MKLLFVLFDFPGVAKCEESRGTLTVNSRKRVHFLAATLGNILIVPRASQVNLERSARRQRISSVLQRRRKAYLSPIRQRANLLRPP
jgi:hypothetical protein